MATALESTTEHQPRARVALSAALATQPSHAYLFRGPRGAGKSAIARAFAAEILAAGATDPDDARRRVLIDPSPHPDLVWLRPRGAQHMVEEVREKVIRAASYRPFEADKRVFVIEAAEQMRDESQNALLKTLGGAPRLRPPDPPHRRTGDPPGDNRLPLPTNRLRPTAHRSCRSRARRCRLPRRPRHRSSALRRRPGPRPLPPLGLRPIPTCSGPRTGKGRRGDSPDTQRESASGESPPTAPTASGSPWTQLIKAAESAGEDAEEATRKLLDEETEAGIKRSAKDITDEAKRAGRRRRTEMLDLALELNAGWFRDLAATASGATEVVFNRDRLADLQSRAASLDPARPRRAAELVQDTRRRLDLNVSEELALEALAFRLAAVFA